MADPPPSPRLDSRDRAQVKLRPTARIPRWVKVFGIIGVIGLVLVVGLHVTGHGMGDHGMAEHGAPAP